MDELKTPAGLQAALVRHGPRLAAGLMAALIALQAGFFVTNAEPRAGPPGGCARPGQRPRGTRPTAPRPPPAPCTCRKSLRHICLARRTARLMTPTRRKLASNWSWQEYWRCPIRSAAWRSSDPNAGTAKLYTVGSAIPGGVSLYSVYSDRVLLDRGGVIESLFLPRKTPLAGTAPQPADALSPGQRLATLAQGNAAVLGGLVRAQPVFVGTKLIGLPHLSGRTHQRRCLHASGAPSRRSDYRRSTARRSMIVNRANEILQTLSSLASANLTVQRNGQIAGADAQSRDRGQRRREYGRLGIAPRSTHGRARASRAFPQPRGNVAPPVVAEPDDSEAPPVEEPADECVQRQ